MFDHFANHHHSYGGPSRVDVSVTEKRAPTDESIRILAEMQQKVVDSVLGTLKIDVNAVSGEIMFLYQPWSVDEIAIGVAYNVNGKRNHFKTSIGKFQIYQEQNQSNCPESEAVMRIFASKFANHIAASILDNLKIEDVNQILRSR